MPTVIKPLDPSDPNALAAWFDVTLAVDAHDTPSFPLASRRRHMSQYEYPWPGFAEETLLAWHGDRVVGYAQVTMPELENLETVFLSLAVHPDYRRRRIGTDLLDGVYEIARRNGRKVLESTVVQQIPGVAPVDTAGRAFVERLGEKPALTNVRRQWTVDTAADVAVLAAEARDRSTGYELRQWRDRTPDDLVDAIAALETQLTIDMPSDDLVMDPEIYDADRIRAGEAVRIGRGSRSYNTVAVHIETGQVVAVTAISLDGDIDDHAWQQITIVLSAHRGHRLGMLIKIANHEYALGNEPLVRTIDTFNAASNPYMIAVNEQLGFRVADVWEVWQTAVPGNV